MHATTPTVTWLASPELALRQTLEWLDDLGAETYAHDLNIRLTETEESFRYPVQSEVLAELAGRRCYNSFEVGLNPNISRIRTDSNKYIQNIIKSGHGSVLEHVQLTFTFENVSRVFTHELVRHRHAAVSQESLRFVRLDDLGFWTPKALDIPGASDVIGTLYNNAEEAYNQLLTLAAQHEGVDSFDTLSFDKKKYYTSAARRVAPIGLSTAMVWSANIRAIRHIINMRTAPYAEEEIRLVFNQVAILMKEAFPETFFFDMEPTYDPSPTFARPDDLLAHWKTKYTT